MMSASILILILVVFYFNPGRKIITTLLVVENLTVATVVISLIFATKVSALHLLV